MANGWNVVVVRNASGGTKCENKRTPTDRERFRLRRDIVYARRGIKRYKIGWVQSTNPLTGIRRFQLDAGVIVADVRDAGIMSFCHVTADGVAVHPRHGEESLAGFGGVQHCMLRATQHVLALIEERAAAAERVLEENVMP